MPRMHDQSCLKAVTTNFGELKPKTSFVLVLHFITSAIGSYVVIGFFPSVSLLVC